MKGTKSRLIVSILLIIGCLALTVGASFAWFTDSITNSGNKIQAGTLSADLIMYDGTEYISIADRTGSIFNASTTWEPGYTHVAYLGVQNTGSLALNYNIILNITDGGLVGALEYALIDGATAEDLSSVTNWEDFKAQSGAQTGKIMAGKMTVAPNGTLDEVASGVQNETDYFAVAVHMLEGSGNDYQGKSVDIDVTVPIKQASAEEDGFGDPDYDSGAEYPVTDNEELTSALNSADAGDKITLSSGSFTLANGVGIPEGVTISGNGAENTTLTVPSTSSGTYTMGLIIDKPEVTISNITIAPNSNISNENYAGVIVVKEGGAVIDNVEITSNNSASPILVTGSTFGEGDSLTISNSTITSESRSIYIVDGTNGKVIIDNCDITGTYTFNVNSGNSQNLELEIKDSELHGWTSYGHIKSASFTNTSFSQGNSAYNFMRPYTNTTFSGCTFGDGFRIGAGATGLTYEFTDCKYADGTAVTADTIKDKLLDPTGDDTKVLDCTIIVDGISAELQ